MPLAPALVPPVPAVLPPAPELVPPEPEAVRPAVPLNPPAPDALMPAPLMPALATPAVPADTPPAPETLETPAETPAVLPVVPDAAALSPALTPLVPPLVPAPRGRNRLPSPPVPVIGAAAVHIVVSYVQVTGSQSNVPPAIPTDRHVALLRFVGSQGITPVPQGALGAVVAGFTVCTPTPAVGAAAGGGGSEPHAANAAASSGASQDGKTEKPG